MATCCKTPHNKESFESALKDFPCSQGSLCPQGSPCSPVTRTNQHNTILISNNPQWAHVKNLEEYLTLRLIPNNALEVLTIARDHIHLGWILINHPLYGNFKPYQQPFRSLLIQNIKKNSSSKNNPLFDKQSLHLIEQAFIVHRECSYPIMEPAALHPKLSSDCSILDMALVEASIEHACHFFHNPNASQGVSHAS